MTIGRGLDRIDAGDKVTGAAIYPGDIVAEGMLHGLVIFTDQPHARLLSLDVEPALAMPGVVEVVTAEDIPVNEYGLTMFDQPVLIGSGQCSRSIVPTDVSRWEADQLAVVIADSRKAAEDGAKALVANWEQLPVVADIDEALRDETLVHPETGSNVYYKMKIRKGDVDAAWAAAAVVVEGSYELPYQEHAYLQPEAAVSYIDGEGRVTIEIAGQWTHEDQEQIAHALDLPAEEVRVIYPAIGGAFGGREDMSLQIVMAAASRKLYARGIDRPIRIQWSREESIVGHHKRHRGRITSRWGADAEGNILVVEADAYLDAGAYNYTTNKVLGNLHLTVAGPYEIPNARIDSSGVYTTTVPGGAFRGFGSPQGAFAAETQMNKLAAALNMDPVELRRRNTLRDGSTGITMVEMPAGVSMPEVIDACASGAEWGSAPVTAPLRSFATLPSAETSIRRGRGFACAYKNVGFSFGFPERCEATIELHGSEDDVESAVLYHAGADVGQGGHTAWLQMASEATGVPVEDIEVHYSDTATAGDSGSASASRLTWMVGNSILGASEEAAKQWADGARPAIGHFRFVPPATETLDPDTGFGQPNFTYGYVAQAVDVAIDIDTGHIRVEKVACAVDAGKTINPVLVTGQIEGAIAQAHGYTVTERLQVEDGRVLNPRFSSYLIPGIGDVPTQVESLVVEHPDPLGPWGARGIAEMPLIPLAPAVVAALHEATGVWFEQLPLTPDRVVATLRANGIGGI